MKHGWNRRDVTLGGAALIFGSVVGVQPAQAAPGFWNPSALLSDPMENPTPMALHAALDRGNPSEATPPMSVTKEMMLHFVLEAFHNGTLNRMQPIPFTAEACAVGGSGLRVRPGDSMPAIDMAAVMMRGSCNRCATQLAITLFGSIDNAVNAMNAKAREWGMSSTRYVSPSGLNVGSDYGTTNAHDMLLKAAWVHSLWRENSLYNLILNRGGFVPQPASLELFRRRGAPRVAYEQDGVTILSSTGNRLLPDRDDLVPIKTGEWNNGRGEAMKNFIFIWNTPRGVVLSSMMAYPLAQVLNQSQTLISDGETRLALNTVPAPAPQAVTTSETPPATSGEHRTFLTGLLRPQDIRP